MSFTLEYLLKGVIIIVVIIVIIIIIMFLVLRSAVKWSCGPA